MREVITPEVMVRAITLIPVASISDQHQLQSLALLCWTRFLIHSLRSCQSFFAQGPRLSARKILTNSDQRRRREGFVTREFCTKHQRFAWLRPWLRVWVILRPNVHTCDGVWRERGLGWSDCVIRLHFLLALAELIGTVGQPDSMSGKSPIINTKGFKLSLIMNVS